MEGDGVTWDLRDARTLMISTGDENSQMNNVLTMNSNLFNVMSLFLVK